MRSIILTMRGFIKGNKFTGSNDFMGKEIKGPGAQGFEGPSEKHKNPSSNT